MFTLKNLYSHRGSAPEEFPSGKQIFLSPENQGNKCIPGNTYIVISLKLREVDIDTDKLFFEKTDGENFTEHFTLQYIESESD